MAEEKIGLHNLAKAPGSTKNRKRLGRGPGPGTGKPHFEGGQMPITRRLPKRGFTNPFREENQIVRLDDLAQLSGEITRDSLVEAGLVVGNKGQVKVLANGEISQAVTVKGLKVSAGARDK